MRLKKLLPYVLLTMFCILLLMGINGFDSLFGSKIDWISQHTAIPEQFRNNFYQTGNLFPDFIDTLGAGQNVYNLSYYGLFRLDVLISYALPFLSMVSIITGYMIIGYIASINLLYYWLKKHNIHTAIAIFAAIALACSSFIFHSHRQIMFVNYMPFLILALICIDRYLEKGHIIGFIISIFLVINHSYYYSISAIFLCIVYYIYQVHQKEGISLRTIFRKESFIFCLGIGIAILLNGVLLIPTALAMFEADRTSSSTTIVQLLTPKLNLRSILYNSYGLGLTFIAWISVIMGICYKKTRTLSIFCTLAIISPLFWYVFNGTLYARAKILIVMLPLVIYCMALVLQQFIDHEEMKHRWCLLFGLLPIYFINKNVYIDIIATAIILFLMLYRNNPRFIYLAGVICIATCLFTNQKETYVKKSSYAKLTDDSKLESLSNLEDTEGYRFEDFSQNSSTVNSLVTNDLKKTSIYSSIHNSLYSTFSYDIINNPYTTRNNLTMTANSNIFFQTIMGVKYIYTTSTPPVGYEIIEETKNGVIAKNDAVLPIAYVTNSTLSEDAFYNLTYPQTLDALCNNAIVENSSMNTTYQSQISKMESTYQITSQDDSLLLEKVSEGYKVKVDKKSSLTLQVDNSQQIMIINFTLKDVISQKKLDTAITINNIKNKLSSKKATYQNNNYNFSYVVSANTPMEELEIVFSKGEYTISDITIDTMKYETISSRYQQIETIDINDPIEHQILSGHTSVTKEDSYFVTSIPYQKGMTASVDGKEVTIEKVNTAFVGFPINIGEHNIEITFRAPGKTIGLISTGLGGISLLGLSLYIYKIKRGELYGKN